MRSIGLLGAVALLAGCVSTTVPQEPQKAPQKTAPAPQQTPVRKGPLVASKAQVNAFATVVRRVEPVAERECQARTQGRMNCDFRILLDTRRNMPPNAFQSVDASGRPVLTVTQALLADVKNTDEMAFVLSHEAAHHIAGHLGRKQGGAMAGAIVLGGLATALGAGSAGIDLATDIGANVGARTYSKSYELEADSLGTVIAKRSGYNPVRGAEYFTRIPDPGDQFLGSHPPNASRIETVRRVNAQL